MTLLLLEPEKRTTEAGPVHVFCCADQDRALCGEDVSGDEIVDREVPTGCVVCEDLDRIDWCPRYDRPCLPPRD